MNVSVIIPAYNAAATLAKTLDSLLAQTHSAWEAVVVNDGSTDATEATARRYAQQDPRFRVISQANAGVSRARNAGIRAARYERLLFLDADDWILPHHLEALVRRLKEDSSLDIAYCSWAFVSPDGHYVFEGKARKTGDLFDLHAVTCPFAIHCYLTPTRLVERVGGFDPTLTVCEDWDLWQRLARTGARFGAVPELTAPCRMRPSSASTDGQGLVEGGLTVLDRTHAPDARVPSGHPARPKGLDPRSLPMQRFYLVLVGGGLAIGNGKDPMPLLAFIDEGMKVWVHGRSMADCLVDGLVQSACRPLSEWDALWEESKAAVEEFLDVMETRTSAEGLRRRVMAYAPSIVRTHQAQLGTAYALRARANRALARLREWKTALKMGKQYPKRFIQAGARMTSTLHGIVRALRHWRSRGDLATEFEGVFQDEDPWQYTNAYEQTKYEQTLDLLPNGPIENALELACAEGHFTERLAPRVERLLAADISTTALSRAQRRCEDHTNVRFQRLDLFTDPIPGRYDLIVCSEVLYFTRGLKQLRQVARKLAAALKPGGCLVMAHGNVVSDDPNHTGFDWTHPCGAQKIGALFSSTPGLRFEREARTPLYRIQRFRRMPDAAHPPRNGRLGHLLPPKQLAHDPARVSRVDMASPLPEIVASQVLWDGCAQELPILAYHHVAPDGPEALAPWRTTPETFESQLRFLREAGYRSARLEDWLKWIEGGTPLKKKSVLITFDDGYADFMEYAWPLLKEYGFDAMLYLVADRIGQTNQWDHRAGAPLPLLDWRQIRRLQAEDVSFGSHTLTHPDLTKLPYREAYREIRRSKDILEQGLGAAVTSLAYPYGLYNTAVEVMTGLSGYHTAVRCDAPACCTAADALLALPRIEVAERTDLAALLPAVDLVELAPPVAA